MIGTRKFAAVLASVLLLNGCKVGPNYKRPVVVTPDQYRGVAPDLTGQSTAQPFAEMQWETVFQDEALRALIKEALANNYDMLIAASRILQAQAVVGITRANQLPNVSGSGGVDYQRNSFALNGPTVDSLGISLNYIVDFWGKYRRATEAARAQLLATTYGRDVVQTTLISNIAIAYYALRQFDDQLEFSQRNVAADTDIVRINTVKYTGGDSAITDVYQADLLLQQAQAQVISAQQSIAQTENQISILLGRNPGPIARGIALVDQPHLATVPTGLPSALLERRPDVRQSEELLVAANANVGVAKAAYFPQISLTGQFGAASTALTSFLQGPATVWSLGGQVLQPLYAGGAITSAYKLAWAQRNESELTYKQTALNAFGDVANSLVGYNQARLFRMKIEEQTNTYQETARLANVRFSGGVTSFLEVLVTQQQFFTSELALAAAWNTEMQNYVQLYQALGGGWQP
ncbi:efflux transporter outer membrane subunit [Tunturiibacter gelidoferens]|uniref:Multidrug efflux system outer membrane protein n=1 Tax=Tunturiibacter gelidiferens TaxID=3069689 RepID=A0A9X0QBW9_9BACT|nr:efflux transporter outer membrane subunit [Edaphobacter lichenicola]MBB5327527.1 multidrug efflux system outer membrane protein [Edaphobacter lichenicola]